MDRVQHIDLRSRRSPYCSTYRRSFSMLDAQGGGQEEESACRGSDRSRPRSAWFSCWRPAQASPQRHRPPHQPPPPSAPAPASAAAPSEPAVGRGAVPGRGVRDGRQVRGRQRQHPDLQRPAGRGAAPAARAGLGVPHRRPRQRRRGRLPDDLRQGAARRVDRHQRLRRLRLQPAVAGRLRRPGLPARPDRSREQRSPARLAGHRPVLPRLQRDLQRQGLHDPARRRLPHGLLPQGHPRQGRRRSRRRRGTTT